MDDTLIDTTGSITHYKLKDALQAMVSAGLNVEDFDAALSLLEDLNRKKESARAALLEFLEPLDSDKKYFFIGGSPNLYRKIDP